MLDTTVLILSSFSGKIISLHLFSFKTPILLGKKTRKKCKIKNKEFHLTIA
jgi:hypothetical protein